MFGCVELLIPDIPKSGGGSTNLLYKEREYTVLTDYRCPAFDKGRWGTVLLEVADVTDLETKVYPFNLSKTQNRREFTGDKLIIADQTIPCKVEKNFVAVYYNDMSGSYRVARFNMNDPKINCLYYQHDGIVNRTEIIDLWHQLNDDNDNNPIVFEVAFPPL